MVAQWRGTGGKILKICYSISKCQIALKSQFFFRIHVKLYLSTYFSIYTEFINSIYPNSIYLLLLYIYLSMYPSDIYLSTYMYIYIYIYLSMYPFLNVISLCRRWRGRRPRIRGCWSRSRCLYNTTHIAIIVI